MASPLIFEIYNNVLKVNTNFITVNCGDVVGCNNMAFDGGLGLVLHVS